MTRSGYVEDLKEHILNLYRGRVTRTIKGKRGQTFLRELANAMDSMSQKVLIADELIDDKGDCCAIGVVCKARGSDMSHTDYYDTESVGDLAGISRTMAAEISYENDEGSFRVDTPEQRWCRMRIWVRQQILTQQPPEKNHATKSR